MEPNEKCLKCGLYKTSCHLMYSASKLPGVGPKNAKIMFIGDICRQEEIIQQKVFVGEPYKLFDEALELAGLKREEVYLTSVIKCRTPNNATPKSLEIKTCYEYLAEEIREIKPKVICVLGSVALETILKRKGISTIRGEVFDVEIEGVKTKVIPVYHPEHVNYRKEIPQLKLDMQKDIKLVKEVSETENWVKKVLPVIYNTKPTVEEILQYIEEIRVKKIFSYDVETTGFDFLKDNLISLALCHTPTNALGFYLSDYLPDELDRIFNRLMAIFTDNTIIKVAHNAKFDNKFLRTYMFGTQVRLPQADPMLMHFLLDENSEHDLKTLAYKFTDMGGYDDEIDNWFKNWKVDEKKKLFKMKREGEIDEEECRERVKELDSYGNIPRDMLMKYNCADADCTLRLYYIFKEMLIKEGVDKVHDLILMPLSFILTDTEYRGIQIDIEYLKVFEKELREQIDDILVRIFEREEVRKVEKAINTVETKKDGVLIATKVLEPTDKKYAKFNINSNPQLQMLLFTFGNLQPLKRTKTGFSTDSDTLEELAKTSELVKLILQYRKHKHDLANYVEQLKRNLDSNNRAHTDYKIHGSVSGRIISHKPNLQNIPRESHVKRLFIAEPGCVLLSADYKQLEYRLWANYSNDEIMLEDIRNDLDIHSEIACMVWPHLYPPGTKVKGEHRVIAKAVVFGIIFGRGIRSLVEELGITEKQASDIMRYILTKYPKAAQWIEDQKKLVRLNKCVKTLFGRIRHLPDIDSQDEEKRAEVYRQCINTPIQSAASDCTSIATIRTYNYMQRLGLKTRMILSIHDSIKFNTPLEELDRAKDCIERGMQETIPKIIVPLVAEFELGTSWENLIEWKEFSEDREKHLKEWRLINV